MKFYIRFFAANLIIFTVLSFIFVNVLGILINGNFLELNKALLLAVCFGLPSGVSFSIYFVKKYNQVNNRVEFRKILRIGTDTITMTMPYDEAYKMCLDKLSVLKGVEVVHINEKAGKIIAKTTSSLNMTGEKLVVLFTQINEEEVLIKLISYSIMGISPLKNWYNVKKMKKGLI